eukprot:1196916-Rhodomonas_salina.2
MKTEDSPEDAEQVPAWQPLRSVCCLLSLCTNDNKADAASCARVSQGRRKRTQCTGSCARHCTQVAAPVHQA